MTTTAVASPPATRPVAPPQAVVAADDDDINDVTVAPPLGSAGAGYLLLPLSEFGQSLDSPDLDCWFEGFAGRNRAQAEYEITAQGDLKIMPPTGFPGDWHESEAVIEVGIWGRANGGRYGGPTSRFILPDGSRRGPDAWWISPERWRSSPPEARQPPFAAIVPDFIIEIVSPSNRGPDLADKVQRYLQGGARLIWVINARRRQATIHRPGTEPEILDDPELLHGDDVMPGFVFPVRQRIFDNIP